MPDAPGGVAWTDDWTKSGELTPIEHGKRAAGWGAAALLYTDIARDGGHTGPNVRATAQLSHAVGIDVIAGAVLDADHAIAALRDAGIPAAVGGRAISDKRSTVADALRVVRGQA